MHDLVGLQLVVVLGAALLAANVAAQRLRVAPPVLLLLIGVLLAFVPSLRGVHLPPDVVLLLFLPALVYWEAITTSLREIRSNLRGIVLMSTALVVLTAAAVAAVGHGLGLPWGPVWVLGAALAPEFAPFFQTTWTEETDPNLLYNLQTRINGHAIIDRDEQQRAVQAFLDAKGQPKGVAHKTISSNIDPAVNRFENQLTAEDQADFRDALTASTRAYAFLGQVVPYTDTDLESLFYYGKLLLEALPADSNELGRIDLGDTALQFIGHEAGLVTSASNTPTDSDGRLDGFTGGGRGSDQDPIMVRLSETIRTFNDTYGIDISEADALTLFVVIPNQMAESEALQRMAADNTEEQFGLTIKADDVAGAIFDHQDATDRLLKTVTEDPSIAAESLKHVRAATYKAAREKWLQKAEGS